jgi:PmbA protein
MNTHELAQKVIGLLQAQGAQKSQVAIKVLDKTELNAENGEFFLLRSTKDFSVEMRAIKDNRQATLSHNKLNPSDIEKEVTNLMLQVESSNADPAFDIRNESGNKKYESGPLVADKELMHQRVEECIHDIKSKYPLINLRNIGLEHNLKSEIFANSTGLILEQKQGYYGFGSLFSASQNNKVSSFNYRHGSLRELSKPLMSFMALEQSIRETEQLISAAPLQSSFEGDIVVDPMCFFDDFIHPFINTISDSSMIAAKSVFRDKLNQIIFNQGLSLSACPQNKNAATQDFYDGEGFETENFDVVKNGTLKSFLLSPYASRKIKIARTPTSSQHFSVASGSKKYSELLQQCKKGLLLNRFSGGRPSENGDFSGVAKNSFLIEDGKITQALNEVMVSGNIFTLLAGDCDFSTETLNNGSIQSPWAYLRGVKISGK